MRLYLDQMLRRDLADLLRGVGHDVLRASEAGQARATDDLILARALAEQRILITLDEHFGDWAVLPLNRHPGVIRLKIHPPTTEALAARLVPFLQSYPAPSFENHLVIVGPSRERWVLTASSA
jgi:predicted nuclease of predicted toxin-antitoxin system